MDKTIVTVDEIEDITVVRIKEKRLYQNTVPVFQKTMVSLLDSGKCSFILDLSEVDLMNSSGLGVLILTWDRLKKEQGTLIITGLCDFMKELFERMRLDLIFVIKDSVEDALKIIKKK
jgi:anti-sigma B factor antagonist